ncbi:flagellin FliC [Solirubrobacter sp. CPCC 204708]|uniref:Flagellin n=1 Tax=Solirubrobacter deserti TaxID=2282478 RepID=A0ABT4RME3_9ACTN|nr:flagellin [Solirubrobacter deserti]MBE2316906.1 flagellin FliC [Solirubrobacter deserti]MDA0139737.1 flagellin [Solirubrobacter deserti]
MGLRIQNNVEAFNAHRTLTATGVQASKAMEKLSSGYRINRAADDAAGLGISEKMRSQISGLGQAQRNAQDAISLVQTAEGALGEVHSMLERVRDLKVQIGGGTLDTSDKEAIGAEVIQIATEIKDILTNTSFNGKKLLDGSAGSAFTFQVGANASETISLASSTLSTAAIAGGGLTEVLALSGAANAGAAVTSLEAAGLSLTNLTSAIDNVSEQRGTYGAVQNRLEHRLNNLATYQENLTAAESRIRDVDMAAEMTKFTKLNILQQAGTSMLAQANQAPQGVLSLLR